MLKNQFIKLKITPKNFEYYKKLNYKFNHVGDEITIKTMDLPKQSKHPVIVICDVCGEEKEVMFMNYIKNIENGGYFACSQKCSLNKKINTHVQKTGYEYANQSPEEKDHLRTQAKKNWNNPEYIEKLKKTNQKKYGVDWNLSIPRNKNKNSD
jgi:hypothetical protein